jgi:hypothetical protein
VTERSQLKRNADYETASTIYIDKEKISENDANNINGALIKLLHKIYLES